MTNKEAIASLKTLCHTCELFPKCVNDKPECFQAIELAISALQEQDSPKPIAESVQNVQNEDLNSRKAAIDAVEHITSSMSVCVNTDECHGMKRMQRQAVIELANLPSAQSEIVRCKDCKHHWTHRCMDSMPTEICDLDQTFYDANVDFCSLAERRTDEGD